MTWYKIVIQDYFLVLYYGIRVVSLCSSLVAHQHGTDLPFPLDEATKSIFSPP